MRTDLRSRLGRAAAAIAVGAVALAGVASAADAQTWNGQTWNGWNGYNTPQYPYYNRSMDRGWTWGERYGAPPANTYYSAPGYYAPPAYDNGSQAALGQLQGLFVH